MFNNARKFRIFNHEVMEELVVLVIGDSVEVTAIRNGNEFSKPRRYSKVSFIDSIEARLQMDKNLGFRIVY